MDKNSTVWLNIDSHPTIKEFWNHYRPIILGLEGETHDLIVCGEAEYMLTIDYSSYSRIVLRATVPIVDYDGFRAKAAQFLHGYYQCPTYGATLAVRTRKFGSREVWTEVTHD